MTLAHGDTGQHVQTLQQRLNRAGFNLVVDGIYGDATEAAVRAYQEKHDLIADGIAGTITLAALRGNPPANTVLQQSDLVAAAATLDVDLAAIQAVTQIEAKNSGFFAPNRPAILFERHVMYRRMAAHGIDPAPAAREHPDIVNQQPGGYEGGIQEHVRLIRAQEICAAAAPECASWGLFQIMGYHWQTLDYESQYEYARLMSESEQNQLEAFVRFIQVSPAVHEALAAHDWAEFARRYNGPNYASNNYDVRLARAHERHATARV